MIVYDFPQGSREWVQARLARPTASQLHRIFQPVRRKPSLQRDLYLLELLDEYQMGKKDEPYSDHWTIRGKELEAAARFSFTMETGLDVRTVGFITRDDGLFGGSPDGLIGEDAIIEIKCASPQVHQKILDGKSPGHIAQCQSLLYVTEREKAYLWHFSPTSDSVLTVIERDDDLIRDMEPVLNAFIEELQAEKYKLAQAYGWAS